MRSPAFTCTAAGIALNSGSPRRKSLVSTALRSNRISSSVARRSACSGPSERSHCARCAGSRSSASSSSWLSLFQSTESILTAASLFQHRRQQQTRLLPVAPHGAVGNAERPGNLRFRHAGEVTHLDDAHEPLIVHLQRLDRLVDQHHLILAGSRLFRE